MTTGFTGADLANLVNEAALLAGRRNKVRGRSQIWGRFQGGRMLCGFHCQNALRGGLIWSFGFCNRPTD
jgi:hypothetical protein